MKVSGFLETIRDGDVSVLVEADWDVTLDGLLSLPVAAGPLVRLDPGLCGSPVESGAAEDAFPGVPLHLRGLDAEWTDRPGFVVAQSVRRGLAWLADHWRPEGPGAVDIAVRSLRRRRAPVDEQVTRLGTLLVPADDARRERCPHSCDSGPGSLPRTAVMGRRDFERACQEVPGTRGRFHVRVQPKPYLDRDDEARVAVVIPRTTRIAGRDIPRWDILMAPGHGGLDRSSARCCRGGQWTSCSLSRLDPRDREEFEGEGRLVRFRHADLTQGAVLRPRFLLRVPEPVAQVPASCPLPEPAAGLPGAFLLDSRFPLDLDADLPIVDEAHAAWAVLLRTTGGVFLPDAGPRALPKAFQSLAGTWLVACTPRIEVTP